MVGVAGEAVAQELGMNAGATLSGVLELFQDDDAGALAEHEAVAVAIPGT